MNNLLYARHYRKMVPVPVRPWQVTVAGVLSLIWILLLWLTKYTLDVEPYVGTPDFGTALELTAVSLAWPTVFNLMVAGALMAGVRGLRTLVAIRGASTLVLGILLAPDAGSVTVTEYAGVLCAVTAAVLVWTPGAGTFFRASRTWWAGLKAQRVNEKRTAKASKM